MITQQSLFIPVTRELVPEDQRLAITDKLFGIRYPLELEPAIFNFTERLSEDYKGGYWDFFLLSNGGFYLSLAGDRTYHVISDNFLEGDLSSDALSLAACLNAYSHLSFVGSAAFSDTYTDHYHRLLEFAMYHEETKFILKIID